MYERSMLWSSLSNVACRADALIQDSIPAPGADALVETALHHATTIVSGDTRRQGPVQPRLLMTIVADEKRTTQVAQELEQVSKLQEYVNSEALRGLLNASCSTVV
jgi:hypothetical protein